MMCSATKSVLGNLGDHHFQALDFLAAGPDCIGVIDSDEKLAAALVFSDLQRRGLAIASIGAEGPTFHITPAGQVARAARPRSAHEKGV